MVVGVAKRHPDWECYGIDLSEAALAVASKLASKQNTKVKLSRGSYLEPLPFEGKFHVISAMGTIHHCADPVGALKNLGRYLEASGFLLPHLYGMRADREKFDIKESLSILGPDLTNHQSRFQF